MNKTFKNKYYVGDYTILLDIKKGEVILKEFEIIGINKKGYNLKEVEGSSFYNSVSEENMYNSLEEIATVFPVIIRNAIHKIDSEEAENLFD